MTIQELLSSPECWTKGALARTREGRVADPQSDDAAAWCLLGALMKCYPETVVECLVEPIADHLGIMLADSNRRFPLTQWNDHPDRTWDDVMHLVRHLGI